jgi:hypothetical protein
MSPGGVGQVGVVARTVLQQISNAELCGHEESVRNIVASGELIQQHSWWKGPMGW